MNKKPDRKKKYTKPTIRTEKIFEANALACGKAKPQSPACLRNLKKS
ncbi:MAG TPA: hypothetical protein VJC37_00655 [Planctomycetota bacterium]|nr:hypothetical protein [Planctomycetota bacterium]